MVQLNHKRGGGGVGGCLRADGLTSMEGVGGCLKVPGAWTPTRSSGGGWLRGARLSFSFHSSLRQ